MRVPGFAKVVGMALLAVCIARFSEAAEVTIGWEPPASGVIVGYVVYYGTAPHSYTQQVDVGAVTTYTVSGLSGGTTYYFAVRSYNAAGALSDFSGEVSEAIQGTPAPASAPPTSAGPCLTPDPFAAMGGGVCYQGGWLPPGMTPPSAGTTAPPPAQAPSSITPAPSSGGSGGCTTPDPFAAMGGGTCYSGGWLPPGMVAPSSVPVTPAPGPAVTPSTTPAPSAPPVATSPAATCSTPDPFAAIGGGTCYNGGWLPPGMAVPGGSSAPAPTMPSTPSPPVTAGGCVTPDPFTAIGGGRCINGGWIPRSMGGGH